MGELTKNRRNTRNVVATLDHNWDVCHVWILSKCDNSRGFGKSEMIKFWWISRSNGGKMFYILYIGTFFWRKCRLLEKLPKLGGEENRSALLMGKTPNQSQVEQVVNTIIKRWMNLPSWYKWIVQSSTRNMSKLDSKWNSHNEIRPIGEKLAIWYARGFLQSCFWRSYDTTWPRRQAK